jgi:hypothetical protein
VLSETITEDTRHYFSITAKIAALNVPVRQCLPLLSTGSLHFLCVLLGLIGGVIVAVKVRNEQR